MNLRAEENLMAIVAHLKSKGYDGVNPYMIVEIGDFIHDSEVKNLTIPVSWGFLKGIYALIANKRQKKKIKKS